MIAVVKFFKALLLLVVAVGSYRILNHDWTEAAREWGHRLSIDPENHALRLLIVGPLNDLLAKVATVRPAQLRGIRIWSLLFAADQVAEGIGLWYNQAWAKYLLLAVTPFFFVYETVRLLIEIAHGKVSTFHAYSVPITAAVLVYLIWIFRADYKRARAMSAA